ncbi:hypothetical protein Lesp02_35780 [Lentzea sp. NBRC 105346]|uniref:oxygenase MpaB family protein n=1 Tax=Lentzea sp. NBRC 105346 TaxID=3032205 RepID=UPI0024A26A8C|nr:oxygenase MpaB family protein [Lentzea sp. NBRC 105346]GLZ31390.1 hypothetical protein Lesp02_35780 [Lentzea sp. NBRC 105346]
MLDPDSVSWQMHSDPAMWIAGISSLYLQSLHPVAAEAIVKHSNFHTDPLGRLRRTAEFVALSVYGAPDDLAVAARRVRSVHRRLRVDEPELLLWVHCAEVYSFLTVMQRAGYGLTPRQENLYLDEQRRTATLVGLHADEVPGSRAEMQDYFVRVQPELARSPWSDEIYHFLHGPRVTGWLRHGLPLYEALVGHLAYSVLPPWAVELHGYTPYRHPDLGLRVLRRAALLIPGRVRRLVPPGEIRKAIHRLGPGVTPSKRKLP